jgi:hypothetical protein
MKFNVIVKIRNYKYKKIYEGHHFISMAMEVHNIPEWNMDCFIRECVHLFSQEVIYSCFFTFNFSSNVLTLLFNVFVIERKIVLEGDACSRPLIITIKIHNLHPSNIKRIMGEIASYSEKD